MPDLKPARNFIQKKSVIYVLLFSMPALLAAIMISLFLFGATVGILSTLVFNNSPWPANTHYILTAVIAITGIVLWSGLMVAACKFGKKQDPETPLNTRHVMASIRATAILGLFVAIYQWNAGNIGEKSDGEMCSDFCELKGFAASGLMPGDNGVMCSCTDARGMESVKSVESITVPIKDVTGGQTR